MHEKKQDYTSFGEIATMPWLEGSTSLSHLVMEEELWLNEGNEWKREGCGWIERQRCLKASTGSITVCKREMCLRVTPHPPFIDFLGFEALGLGFSPFFGLLAQFHPNFSSF